MTKCMSLFSSLRRGQHQCPTTKILMNGGEGRVFAAIRGGGGGLRRNEVFCCSEEVFCDKG